MPASEPPPSSSVIPGKSGGSGPYIAGVVVLGALIVGMVVWKSKRSEPPRTTPTVAFTTTPEQPVPLNAPPPPPKLEELDAGTDAAVAKTSAPTGALPAGPCGGKCGDGTSSPALEAALRSTAGSAQGCYNRALRNSEVSGSMVVSVSVGSSGAVCGASIAKDSVGSSEVSSCVLGRFRGRTFPPPQSGCVVVNIPISFTIKQ